MEDQDYWIEEITRYLVRGKLAFLVGAGISANRQSWLPLWTELIEEILIAVAGEKNFKEIEYVKQHTGQLLNEVILQIMGETIGKENTSEILDRCLNTTQFSWIHQFFAWGVQNHNCVILTPNYDELIEHALSFNKTNLARNTSDLNENIIKLHGTISRINEARFYVDSVFEPVEEAIADRVVLSLNDRMLIVAGYRGADEFDVIPLIFEKCKPEKILWISRPNSRNNEFIDFSIGQLLHKTGSSYITSDIDELFKKVYSRTTRIANYSSNANRSKIPMNPQKGNKERWWNEQFENWKIDLWKEKSSEMRLLWARILEHVRIYDNGKGDNLVKIAYERFLESQPNNRILELDAKAHIVYALRTTNIYDFPKFEEIISEIEMELNNETEKDLRKKLNALYSWTIHEYGIGLQNSKKNFQAKLMFEKAATIRIIDGDPHYIYTVFQQFMNGYADRETSGNIDTFAPNGWRNWLIDELDEYCNLFYSTYQIANYSTTMHNKGFIYQYLAKEASDIADYQEAQELLLEATKYYNEAYNIREKIRDPRRIAQSIVRIAQCQLEKAKIMSLLDQEKEAQPLIHDSIRLAKKVQELYSNMPQEPFRERDIEDIISIAEELIHQT